MTVRFGYGLITCQRYPGDPRTDADLYQEAIELTADAEQLGFDSAWTRAEVSTNGAQEPCGSHAEDTNLPGNFQAGGGPHESSEAPVAPDPGYLMRTNQLWRCRDPARGAWLWKRSGSRRPPVNSLLGGRVHLLRRDEHGRADAHCAA